MANATWETRKTLNWGVGKIVNDHTWEQRKPSHTASNQSQSVNNITQLMQHGKYAPPCLSANLLFASHLAFVYSLLIGLNV